MSKEGQNEMLDWLKTGKNPRANESSEVTDTAEATEQTADQPTSTEDTPKDESPVEDKGTQDASPKVDDSEASKPAKEDEPEPKTEDTPEPKKEEEPKADYKDLIDSAFKDKTDKPESKEETEKDTKDNTPDWRNFFDTEDEYKAHIARKKGFRVTPDEVDNMEPMDLITNRYIQEMGKYGLKSKDAVESMLMDKYNVSDMEDLPQYRLAQEAKGAADYFQSAFSDIDIPTTQTKEQNVEPNTDTTQEDVQRAKEETLKAWEDISSKLVQHKDFSTVNIDIGDDKFSYEMDEEFKSSLPKRIKDYAQRQNLDLTEETLGQVMEVFQGEYKLKKMPYIMKAREDQVRSKLEEEFNSKIDNPHSKDTKPSGQEKKDRAAQMMEYVKSGKR